jgi:hypothetical protein
MYVQHVFLVGFVVIVVISLTLWMLSIDAVICESVLLPCVVTIRWREKA